MATLIEVTVSLEPKKIIASLERKYAELLGTHEADSSIDGKLAALKTVIMLWQPDWSPAAIQPARKRAGYVDHGLQSQLIHEFIRLSEDVFSTDDAANYVLKVLAERDLPAPPQKNIKQSAHSIFRRLEESIVEPLGTRPETWKLK